MATSEPLPVDPRELEIQLEVDRFLAGYDLQSDFDRFRAYRDSLTFAQERLLSHPFCNLFLDRVARAVGREPAYLDSLSARVGLPEGARLDFCYEDDWGFVITGNGEGLDYLANLLHELRSAPCRLDHLHLANDHSPLGSRSYPVTIYKEGDDWFERLEAGDDSGGEEDGWRREIDPHQVFAVQLLHYPPPELPLSIHRIYRIRGIRPHPSEESAEGGPIVKPFSADPARRFAFTLFGDVKSAVEIVLHLDDPGVNFFAKRDLMRVVLESA